jgi:PAS domain S-box-containing protein
MTYNPLRILLVHDSGLSRSATRRLLLQTDLVHSELDCVSTNFALEKFRSNYNVCVIDSPANGSQLLQAALQVGFTAPIIMLTGNSASEVLAAMRLGAADCLVRQTLTAAALEASICLVIENARSSEFKAECTRLYLSLVEHSNEIMYTHDLQGNCPFINQAGEQLIKYNSEEVAKINFRQIISPEFVDEVWWTIERMLLDRKQAHCETVFVTKEGQRVPVSVTMHLVYKEGTPVCVQGFARDLRWQTAWLPLTESEQIVSFLL